MSRKRKKQQAAGSRQPVARTRESIAAPETSTGTITGLDRWGTVHTLTLQADGTWRGELEIAGENPEPFFVADNIAREWQHRFKERARNEAEALA